MRIRYLCLSVLLLVGFLVVSAEAKMRFIRLNPGETVNLDDIIIQCGDYKAEYSEKNIDKKLEKKKINLERKIAQYKKNGDKLAKFCMKMAFKKEREECSKIKVTYLEEGAVKMCENMTDNGKLSCINVIKDKVYSDSELTLASQATFEKDKIASLSNSGIDINDLKNDK